MEPADILRAGDDARERGLHFICFNTHIGRQFEFIQHTWVNSPKFDGLYTDDDPLVGDRGARARMKAGRSPSRRRPPQARLRPAAVRARPGRGLFFMPGIRAVRFLAALP